MSKAASPAKCWRPTPKGQVDPGLIGGKICGIADGLRAILAGGSDSARSVLAGLRRRNLDLGRCQGGAPVRRRQRGGRAGGLHRAGLRRADRRRARNGDGARGPGHRDRDRSADRARRAALGGIRAAARSAGRHDARFRSAAFLRARLRGEGRRLHPDRRPVRPAMLRLPLPQCARAAKGDRARPRQHRHAHVAGPRLSGAGPVRQGVRPGFPADGRTGAGHLRPARQFRARLHGRNTTRTWAIRATPIARTISATRSRPMA